ncbi:MAG: helix-hairpin-helix domain-containing protein [Flavobacterium sp.]|nr:helix-hairpin-helix domain-containing protein [Pedobacter sp.]
MFRSYFNFSKKELNGISILCLLIFIVLVFPYIYNKFQNKEVYHFDNFDLEVKQFLATAKNNNSENYYKTRDEIENAEFKAVYFLFDPNNLSEENWKKLGLSIKQIKTIKNYEAKGGKFYSNKDVQKMYSITAKQYASLEPFIRIIKSKKTYPPENSFKSKLYKKNVINDRLVIIVDINLADSGELETIRGVGPAFAARIIKLRTRLGGFYNIAQLLDVYGLDSLKYQNLKNQVKADPAYITKININSVTFDELKSHPYLTYKQMNAIIQYRKQHGSYRSAADLKNIAILSESTLIKFEPYLIFK